jgi:hypothetical protein
MYIYVKKSNNYIIPFFISNPVGYNGGHVSCGGKIANINRGHRQYVAPSEDIVALMSRCI